uniref:Metal-dependent transcriptional regulator n=1 Tax=Fervidicoccus fontis TaxID=683846 RepID=A0A7J3ZJP2_9CREN
MEAKTTLAAKLKSAGAEIEDYLTTIFRLEEVYSVARTTHIARELSVTPATVAKVIAQLEGRGLVERKKYYGVRLTEKGREIARGIIRKHRIAEVFLTSFLGLDELEAHVYAHRFEHLPGEILERLYSKLGRPERCPHGNVIPGALAEPQERPQENAVKLSAVQLKGSTLVVRRVAGELLEPLKKAQESGIRPGSKLRVLEQKRAYTLIELGDGRRVKIPREIAETIYVEVQEGC